MLARCLALLLLLPPLLGLTPQHASHGMAVDPATLRDAYVRVGGAIRALPRGFTLTPLLQRTLTADTANTAVLADQHRATLLVIACYVNGWSLGGLLPEARTWTPLPRRLVRLQGREDLAQHFMLSATLTAMSGSPLADTVALLKETADTRGGSGFSFSDLAAHRAGTLFGRQATASAASATRLAAALELPMTDEQLMPDTEGLPDNLTGAEFSRRIGRVGSPAYNALIQDIDRRIVALPLYRSSEP